MLSLVIFYSIVLFLANVRDDYFYFTKEANLVFSYCINIFMMLLQ